MREARRLGIRRDVGQGIDARAARQRIGRAVHVERQEQARAQVRRAIAGALVERADIGRRRGSTRPHPAALRQPVAQARAPAPGSIAFRSGRPTPPVRPGRARHGRGRSPRSAGPAAGASMTFTSATAGARSTVSAPRRASPTTARAPHRTVPAGRRRRSPDERQQPPASDGQRRPASSRLHRSQSARHSLVQPALHSGHSYHADMVNA